MSYNSAELIGNLGNDPDLKFTQGGTAICKLSVATSERRKDKDGNQQELTTWHRVTVFGKSAEACGEYLVKGSKIFVRGRIHNDSYDKDGVKHYTSEIVADTVRFLDKREGGTSSTGPRGGAPQQQRRAPATEQSVDDFMDDPDIPFVTNRSSY